MSQYVDFQISQDTSANWTSNNPTPLSGQLCWETDTKRAKIGDGSTAWTLLPYLITGLQAAEATVASATTTNIGATTSQYVSITGTTAITGFGTAAVGVSRIVRFTGALTLTHNGTSLILPSGANITTASGDALIAVSLGSGNWFVPFYGKADGHAVVDDNSGGGGGGGGTKTYAVFGPEHAQPPSTDFATLDTRNGLPVLCFDDTTQQSTTFGGIMLEAASLGSGLKVRAWVAGATATTGDVVLGAQLERGNTDIDSDSFDTAAEATITTSGTSGIFTLCEITLTNIDSVAEGETYRLRIYRKAADAADTMAGKAQIRRVEVRSAAA